MEIPKEIHEELVQMVKKQGVMHAVKSSKLNYRTVVSACNSGKIYASKYNFIIKYLKSEKQKLKKDIESIVNVD